MREYEQAATLFPLPLPEPMLEPARLTPGLAGKRVAVSPVPADGIVHFKAYAHLVSVDPDKNRYRFYQLTWQPVLFGGGAIVRRWGRIGTEGRWRAIFFGSRGEAQKTVEEILKRRLGHGYAVVRWE